MANLNDYLTWRGDLKINRKEPINDVDGLALARFSYMPFNRIKVSRVETVSNIAKKMEKLPTSVYVWPDDQKFIALMGKSQRFGQLKVTDYIRKNNPEIAKQFSAITVHINRRDLYISFMGTDEHLFGWKEDFNMAFMESVPAQKEALKYLKHIAKKYPWKRIWIGGHSKGGNISMYSAIMSPELLQRRIVKVYNFDGPGLNKKIYDDANLGIILPKIQSFIPQDSIVGRLFDHVEKFEVIKSNAEHFYQHDIYSWEISGTEMVSAEITKRSDVIDKTLTDWIEGMSFEQKKIFTDVIFRLFSKNDLNTPREFAETWTKSLPAVLKTYRSVSKKDRKVITDAVKRLIRSYLAARRSR